MDWGRRKFVLGTLGAGGLALGLDSPIREGFALHNGLRIRYVTAGEGPQAILLVHGWTCDSSFWKPQIEDFAQTHRVIAVDLPGHGGSSKPSIDYTVELFAGAINAAMMHAKIERAVVAGHSMGVPVAMQFVQDHPEKASGFVAVDGALWRMAGKRVGRTPWLNRLNANYYGTAGAYIESMFVSGTTTAMRKEIRTKMLATPRHVGFSSLDRLADSLVWERGPNRIATLAIVAGTRPNDLRAMHEGLFPNLQYEFWPEAGHFLMMEQPARFNSLVRRWMDKLDQSSARGSSGAANANAQGIR